MVGLDSRVMVNCSPALALITLPGGAQEGSRMSARGKSKAAAGLNDLMLGIVAFSNRRS